MARLREFLPNPSELALLLAARGFACVCAWQVGFRALSDDDYARITIAQRFAEAPHFDPSGTSWLPAPFWTYGAAFRAFGTGLEVARATAIGLSLGATVLLYVAARLLGSGKGAALGGAFIATLGISYSVCLGIAAVPEVPCAALAIFGAASLLQVDARWRLWGALALSVACLSRYEVWPIAAVVAAYGAIDAITLRRPRFALAGLVAVIGIATWLSIGVLEHGDAAFFVTRVTAYRRALGGLDASLFQRVLEYPVLLVTEAPQLWALTLATVLFLRVRRALRVGERLPLRVLVSLLAMLAFLMLGSVRDGVPTHHAARVLLPIWFFVSLWVAQSLAPFVAGNLRRTSMAVGLVGSVLGTAALIADPSSFAQRASELEAGKAAQARARGMLAIDTPDYGYFAVQAAFGAPRRTRVLDDHDPRHAKQLDSLAELSGDAVVTVAHADRLAPRCAKLWNNAGFALVRCP